LKLTSAVFTFNATVFQKHTRNFTGNYKSSAIVKMAMQHRTSQILTVKWGYLSLMHSFSLISENVAINHI